MPRRKKERVDPQTGEITEEVIYPYIDELGREVHDPTPVELPARISRAQGLIDEVRRVIQNELSRAAERAGLETEEDADDFDIGDDYEPTSPHEFDRIDEDRERFEYEQRRRENEDRNKERARRQEGDDREDDREPQDRVQQGRQESQGRSERARRDQRAPGGQAPRERRRPRPRIEDDDGDLNDD